MSSKSRKILRRLINANAEASIPQTEFGARAPAVHHVEIIVEHLPKMHYK